LTPRVRPAEYSAIRNCVEKVGFDPAKLLFCVYRPADAEALTELFPESTLLYKIKTAYDDVSKDTLDEVVKLKMDGVMLFRPIFDQDFSTFMSELEKRQLQVLFYVHGGWPKPHKPDDVSKSLQKMIASKVDYVTTIRCDLPEFKELVGMPLSNSDTQNL